MISIEDFAKLELKVGTVISAEDVEESEKLIKLQVDLGPLERHSELDSESETTEMLKQVQHDKSDAGKEERDIRQILSGVKQWYKPEDFLDKQVVVIANLEPRMMMGIESQGMLLAASDEEEGPIFLTTPKPVKPGTKIR